MDSPSAIMRRIRRLKSIPAAPDRRYAPPTPAPTAAAPPPEPDPPAPPAQAPAPHPGHHALYSALMRSHDRMGTRHL